MYGILEGQFRAYFQRADMKKGVTGENLLSFLERRLDNVIYRLGFAASRNQARQLVRHGIFVLNGHRVTIPSMQVKIGDVVEVREKNRQSPLMRTSFSSMTDSAPSAVWMSEMASLAFRTP